ncbi:hypothetical protein HK102_008406 [Quaeritorhiza haematococci]|nr:hypothetical protein HK102_008406 [Quaeritorhiza haematococci]
MAVMYCLALIGLRIYDLIQYQNQFDFRYSQYNGATSFYYTLPATGIELLIMCLNVVLLFVLLFTVGFLSLYQFYYISKNLTTIESFENDRIDELVRRNKIPASAGTAESFPYDLGMWANLKTVFGREWWLWWLPREAEGDGVHFPVNARLVAGGKPITWPPLEYYVYKNDPNYAGDKVEDDYDDEDDEEEEEYDDGEEEIVRGGDNGMVYRRKHVRRDSEGYVVTEYSNEERQQMLWTAQQQAERYVDGTGGDVDYGSDGGDELTERDRLLDGEDEDEGEVLGVLRQKLRGRGSRGGGRGRGWYYKEKYGGGRSRELREARDASTDNSGYVQMDVDQRQGHRIASASGSTTTVTSSSARTSQELSDILMSIDRSSYGAYKRLLGTFRFPDGTELLVDHIQSDPYAPPSKMRVRVPQSVARFPSGTYTTSTRRIALEHLLTQKFWSYVHKSRFDVANQGGGWHGSKGGDFNIDKPGQQVLERSCMNVTTEYVEARFTVSLPAQGRNILGYQANTILTERLPQVISSTLLYGALDAQELRAFLECVEDQDELRGLIKEAGLIAFVPNGAILPRESGASDLPMRNENVVPFRSPPTLEREFRLPNRGVVKGMGIPRGVCLIVGGGFHGKSTLLDAIKCGVYNHVPGDGREFVSTDEMVIHVRAEDGRSISSVDITPFITNLPFGKGTREFSTADASGSTSMAANIQEALEATRGFLFDEDTCATNFLITDRRMQMLVAREKEPITPLISKIRSLYTERNCSSILVIGGCGSYLDVADVVIAMDNYEPRDVTAQARDVALKIPVGLSDGTLPYGTTAKRVPNIPRFSQEGPANLRAESTSTTEGNSSETASITPARGGGKSSARRTHVITFEGVEVDLSGLEQLVHTSQSRCILDAMQHIRDLSASSVGGHAGTHLSLKELIERLEREWDEKGLDIVHPKGWPAGDYARPRGLEVAGALNRLRGLRARQV